MLCRKCGAEIPDNSQICDYCGTPVTDIEKIYDKNEQIRKNQISRNTEEKRVQLSEIQQRRDEKRAKQKRNKLIAVIVLCLVAAGTVSVSGYFVYDNMKTTRTVVVTPAPSTTPAPTHAAVKPSVSPNVSASPNAASPSPASSWTATGEKGSGANNSSDNTGKTAGSGASSNKTVSKENGTSVNNTSGSKNNVSSSNNGSLNTHSGGSASGNTSSGGGHYYNVSAKNSGISTKDISSQITVGGEVINENDKWYMTFTNGNTKYYAHVNPGATTVQVANKVYTMTAIPTNETYNGNTVYEITSMTKYDGNGYILPDSGVRTLTNADLAGLSKNDLALARNEIYARHGRRFQTKVYRDYFTSKSWYYENPNYNYENDNSNLNSIEVKNVDLILKAEQ